MIPLDAATLAAVVGGELLSEGPGTALVTGVSIDSRTTRPGDLFVPLLGEHSDGHRFIADAVAAGAVAYLCAEDHAESLRLRDGGAGETSHHGGSFHPQDTCAAAILVDDPLDALTGLGAWVRDEVDPVVVAITGSNGKTTTKDLAAAAIAAAKVTVANPGSFNNEIGLPLTLCLLTPETEVLVCEVGARGSGHIAAVMPLLRPDVAVVTTIAGAHIGEFGSLEAITAAKGELIEGLGSGGIAVLNLDVPAVAGLAALAPGTVVTVGLDHAADLHPDEVTYDGSATATLRLGEVVVRLPRPGAHNVGNALAALAAAVAVGVPLDVAAAGLAGAAVSRWRMEVTRTSAGVVVVNDAYNANPHSVLAALDTLAAMAAAGRRWAVLGFMAELGDQTGAGHTEVGAYLAQAGKDGAGIDGVVVVEARAGAIADGARAAGFGGRILTAAEPGEAADVIAREVRPGDVVLVKASRSVGLEHLVAALLSDLGGAVA